MNWFANSSAIPVWSEIFPLLSHKNSCFNDYFLKISKKLRDKK